jgi:hypothetical protein
LIPLDAGGAVADVLAYYKARGFAPLESPPELIVMERTHSWLAVLLGTIVGFAFPAVYRHGVLYLHVQNGIAAVRLRGSQGARMTFHPCARQVITRAKLHLDD